MGATTVYVVEDEKVVGKLLQETLSRLGYEPIGLSTTGEEAVRRVGELRPAIVLMDITLAGEMDGVRAAELIQEQFDIPVVYTTAHSDEKTLRSSKGAPAYAYVYKPVNDQVLRAAIEVAIDRHALERRLRESQQWLSATLRCISEAVIATDVHGRVKFMSAIAEALAATKQESALGKGILQVLPFLDPTTGEPVGDFWARYLKQEWVGFGYHRFLLQREGGEVTVGCSISSIRDDRQKPVGLVMVFREVWDRPRGFLASGPE